MSSPAYGTAIEALRTPDERFEGLPDYDYEPHYVTVRDGLRVHYIDEGPRTGPVVLMMHGEPSWCFLYRHMVRALVPRGYRCICPDLVGFGRSDKPVRQADYTYERHVAWMQDLLDSVPAGGDGVSAGAGVGAAASKRGLRDITLVCQDWGGLVGLRLVAADPARFARVVTANTGLPTGDMPVGKAFMAWREYAAKADPFPVGPIIQRSTVTELSDAVVAAYDAPFPSEAYKAGAKVFPSLVPIAPEQEGAAAAAAAWDVLGRYRRPFLTAFSDSDPITAGGHMLFQGSVPGCEAEGVAGRHTILKGGGHFLQEDVGVELARVTHELIAATPDAARMPALGASL